LSKNLFLSISFRSFPFHGKEEFRLIDYALCIMHYVRICAAIIILQCIIWFLNIERNLQKCAISFDQSQECFHRSFIRSFIRSTSVRHWLALIGHPQVPLNGTRNMILPIENTHTETLPRLCFVPILILIYIFDFLYTIYTTFVFWAYIDLLRIYLET